MQQRPKLGQHFLSGRRYGARIAEALAVEPQGLVIEIGAGRGALTELLAERAGRVLALELDESLAAALEEKFRSHPRIEIVRGDVLAADLEGLCRRAGHADCLVFGNLPYYITSPILHRLFHFRAAIRGMALLVQKEVAERLTAAPGTSAYGYLSVLAQAFSRPRIAFRVPPGAFTPPPQVQSALVTFHMAASLPAEAAERQEEFLEFVKRAFAQKRKKLANNLAAFYSRERVQSELARLSLAATARAEELPIATFAELFLRLTARRAS
jgi:16S rRNA (adenine1518-N6/adenine1519-N6)-dimethyltransferase